MIVDLESYVDLLKDPRWQRRRLEIFQRDDWSCRACLNMTESLAIHHKYYIPHLLPWEYPNSMLITLCSECHNDVTIISHELTYDELWTEMCNAIVNEFHGQNDTEVEYWHKLVIIYSLARQLIAPR